MPNVVPEYSKLWCWVRDSKRSGVEDVLGRVKKMTEGAALMAEVEGKLKIQSGDYEMLVNLTGAKLLYDNMKTLEPIVYTEQEQVFARAIQRAVGMEEKGLNAAVQPLEAQRPDPPGGSSDVADVSWITPTLQLLVTTAPIDSPWHAWPVVACSGMSIGHKGMLYAAKALAMTAVDLFEDGMLRKSIREEFEQNKRGHVYKGYIPDGPPPIPNK